MNEINGINRNKFKRISRLLALMLTAVMILAMSAPVVYGAADSKGSNGTEGIELNLGGPGGKGYELQKFVFSGRVEKNHVTYVTEKLTVNLTTDASTLSFEIPSGNFRVADVKITDADGLFSKTSDRNVITINDQSKLKAGIQEFTVKYAVYEFTDRDNDKDMYFFYALMPRWRQPIGEINIKMAFPDDFPWDDVQYYAGQFGVQSVATKLDYVADEATHTVSIKGERIPENFGIAVKAQLPDQYWEGEMDGTWALLMMVIVLGAIVATLFVMWVAGGRDPKIAPVKQTHPVRGITPEELRYIFNGKVSIRDVVAMIVYFGTKGYLQISEYQPKKYQLIRKAYPANEEKYLRNAYDILFEGVYEDRAVEMDELGIRLRRVKSSIKENIAAGFSSKDMKAYTKLSEVLRSIGIVLLGCGLGIVIAMKYNYQYMAINYVEVAAVFAASVVTSSFLCSRVDRQYFSEDKSFTHHIAVTAVLNALAPVYVSVKVVMATGYYWIPVPIILLYAAGIFFVTIMRARAKGNAALVARFVQLRQFIYHPTPRDVVANLLADSNYYYEILPYAMLFDGLETWAISFLTLNVPKADWLSDDIEGHAFSNLMENPTLLDDAKSIKAFNRTVVEAYRDMERRHPRVKGL